MSITKNLVRNFLVLTLACGLLVACKDMLDPVLVERHTVTTDSFRGLEIGASKQATLEAIARLGTRIVEPRPAVNFEISNKNIDDLHLVERVDGIRLMDYRGFSIDLKIENDAVSKIRRSVPAKENAWFREGDKNSDVKQKLVSLLSENSNLVLIPIIFLDNYTPVNLSERSEQIPELLRRYDAWTFEVASEKPRGAIYDVYFKDDHLSKVEYRRARIQLD